MKLRRRAWLPVLGAGLVLIAVGMVTDDLRVVRETSTYRDFDVPSPQSGVQYLSPGLPDRAHEGAYAFDGPVHTGPLVALGTVFVLFFVLRNVMAGELRRGATQWLAFVVARLGVLRVAGAAPVTRCAAGVFPFLNCQACEMATGACPVGQVQGSLLQRRVPWLALGTVVVAAALLGRWICGWLCPYGLFADMLDRVSLRRFTPRRGWYLGGLVVAGLLVAGTLVFVAAGVVGQAPFCSTICASGKIYGLLPYYATTAAGDVGAGAGLGSLWFHAALFALVLATAIAISGRAWCRYLCPLGAALGLAHRVSAVRVVHRAEDCTDCGQCLPGCPMGIDLARPDFATQSACISCGRCISTCRQGARAWSFPWSEETARAGA